MRQQSLLSKVFVVLASIIAAVEVVCFLLVCVRQTELSSITDSIFTLKNCGAMALLAVVFSGVGFLALRFGGKVGAWCFKYRYIIAGVLCALLVIAQVSGSSLGMMTNLLGGEANDFWGTLRPIRKDEWAVNTPFALSQVQTGCSPISSVALGGGLDLRLVYAQACWDISTLFRPFLWGYLVLPAAYGLSFFWCTRLIGLFMVSFEFGRFVSNDNRRLALVYAALITFSPLVQWWFAVNFIAEILIFSQLFIMLFAKFLHAHKPAHLALMGLGMTYCLTALVLGLYPAWQVMGGYLVAGFCVVLLVRYIRTETNKKSVALHAAVFVVALAVAVGLVLLIVMTSRAEVAAIVGSEYPGSRSETGGGLAELLFTYALPLVAVVDPSSFVPNVCEKAGMFSLFPLGTVLGVVYLIKKRDGYLLVLLVIQAIFLLYGLVGFPQLLAKVTLLSHVTVHRLVLGIGIVEILLIVRCITLALSDKPLCGGMSSAGKVCAFVAVAAAFALAVVMLAKMSSLQHMRSVSWAVSILLIALSVFAVLAACMQGDKKLHGLLCCAALVVLAGLMVNPVQFGLGDLQNTPLANAVQQAESDDDSARHQLWIADNSEIAQACIAYGAPTLNSIALYPRVETWQPVDPEGAYKSVYNRYAHVFVQPTSDDECSFQLTFVDEFFVRLNTQGLKDLGVRYWVSETDLTVYSDNTVQFQRAYDAGPYTVYRLNYA